MRIASSPQFSHVFVVKITKRHQIFYISRTSSTPGTIGHEAPGKLCSDAHCTEIKWISVANATDLVTEDTCVPILATSFVPVVEHQIQMKVIDANPNASYVVWTMPPKTRHAKPNSKNLSV
ncbi:hypothetical protein HPB51_009527 [Rhipicephalus microplus]|uniref:Uncharacterized protein n=1 Tax=Rhipicephalus microplus TaxID=6941 RepID=A0A9J6F159_RHIMP|nr:hypothetical protein HPB51_009527 [Rhipicephalus microplus]